MTHGNSPATITGIKIRWIALRMWIHLFRIALDEYRSYKDVLKTLHAMLTLRKKFAGENHTTKMIGANGRFYWNMHLPGFPSIIFDQHFLGAMNRTIPVRSLHNRLAILFLGITRRCPLKCRHCYDWAPGQQDDTLSVTELQTIISKYLEKGISQVFFLGGEPMVRFDDLVKLVRYIDGKSETWFSTCGYQLDKEKVSILKEAGLTGVMISIDHFDQQKHNAIRGHEQAFDWAMNATQNAVDAGLLSCWSLCLTPELIDLQKLLTYTALAASCHVNFVNILEPMAAGRYAGKNVTIDSQGLNILEEFYLQMNRDPLYSQFPIIVYDGYFSRRLGCLGAGNRYLYIDSLGHAHPCPFCRSSIEINALSDPAETQLDNLKDQGCLLKINDED